MGVLQFKGASPRSGGGGQERRYWSNSGFDDRPDEDNRPWTVVRKGDRIGMIDNTGKVMIPIIFGLYQGVERMVFHMTPRGELAATSKYDHGTFMGYDETIIDLSH